MLLYNIILWRSIELKRISNKKFYNYVFSFTLSRENAPEFFDIVGDIYDTPEFQSMENYIQHANITRKQHIMSVAYLTYLEAKKKNLNYISATRAAMLHDLFYYDWHVAGDGTHRLHGYRHAGFALKNAKKLFVLSQMEEDIILRHMWPLTPTPPKYKEGFIVTFADKYCASNECKIKRSVSFQNLFTQTLKEVNSN